jgi:hypothetical protein
MKITFTKSFALLLFSAAIFSACSKSESKTKTELLTSKPWTQTVLGYDNNLNWTIEESESYLYSCDRDNVWTFRKSDSTLVEDEGSVKCGSATQWTYDWLLSGDGDRLIIDSRSYTIKTLDNYTLEIYYDYQSSNGPSRYIRKFAH